MYTIHPAEFLRRTGYSCDTWSRVHPLRKRDEAIVFVVRGYTMREGASVSEDDFATSELLGIHRNGNALASAVNTYCLQMAVQASRMPRARSQMFSSLKSAGAVEDATPQGWQWGGILFVGAMFTLAYLGLKPETR